jgi:hypothetical protein
MALRNQEFLHYFHANFIKITQNQFKQQFQSTINNKKNNIPNNPYGQVIMNYYEYNISKYQLHQMVKFPEIWI